MFPLPKEDRPSALGQCPTQTDPRHAISMGQHNLTSLDLIVAETSSDLTMWTNDGRFAGDRNP
jgi:hypothetical protein